jgi:hypothetical protein
MTFDNAIVRKKDFERAADDIGRWLVDFPPCGTFVNHLPRIMEIFEEQRDKDCEAIGIWCTSVTVNTYLDLGASDDESEVCLGEGDLLDVYVELDKMRDGGVVEGGTHCGS